MFRQLLYVFEILLVGCGYLFAAIWFDFDRKRRRQRYDVRNRGTINDRRAKAITIIIWISCILLPAALIMAQVVFGLGSDFDAGP
jgi:hypothetical protein